MRWSHSLNPLALALVAALFTLGTASEALAHCDGIDGPVVKAAQKALDTRNSALVLIWVSQNDEAEVRAAFARALAVRALGAEARDLADRYFFETVVRLHRVGEGAPYTGLKPAGRDLGPAVPAADNALLTGSLSALAKLLTETMQQQLRERYDQVVASATFSPGDLAAGRESVKAYVEFIHYVERLYDVARASAPGHFSETDEKQ